VACSRRRPRRSRRIQTGPVGRLDDHRDDQVSRQKENGRQASRTPWGRTLVPLHSSLASLIQPIIVSSMICGSPLSPPGRRRLASSMVTRPTFADVASGRKKKNFRPAPASLPVIRAGVADTPHSFSVPSTTSPDALASVAGMPFTALHNFARSGPTKEARPRALNRPDGLLRFGEAIRGVIGDRSGEAQRGRKSP
jgi:hypothetical protein